MTLYFLFEINLLPFIFASKDFEFLVCVNDTSHLLVMHISQICTNFLWEFFDMRNHANETVLGCRSCVKLFY